MAISLRPLILLLRPKQRIHDKEYCLDGASYCHISVAKLFEDTADQVDPVQIHGMTGHTASTVIDCINSLTYLMACDIPIFDSQTK